MSNELAVFEQTRLPWHPRLEEYGVNRSDWKALVEAVFPSATSVSSIVMALSYCKKRKLDPFKKVVHIVPMWIKERREKQNGRWVTVAPGGYVDTVWPSIAEMRITAFRTGKYAGKDEMELGPIVELKFEQESDPDGETGEIRTRALLIKVPEWGRMTLHRLLENGVVAKFVGPKVHWAEACSRDRNGWPNDMWRRRPFDQFEKVVEAASLRCVFPEEIGNEYVSDEMEGKTLDLAATPSEQVNTQPANGRANGHDQAAIEHKPAMQMEVIGESAPPPREQALVEVAPTPPLQNIQKEEVDRLEKIREFMTSVEEFCRRTYNLPGGDIEAVVKYQRETLLPQKDQWPDEVMKEAFRITSETAQAMMDRAEQHNNQSPNGSQ